MVIHAVIQALERQRKESHEFKASLGHAAESYFKKNKIERKWSKNGKTHEDNNNNKLVK